MKKCKKKAIVDWYGVNSAFHNGSSKIVRSNNGVLSWNFDSFRENKDRDDVHETWISFQCKTRQVEQDWKQDGRLLRESKVVFSFLVRG